MARNKTLGKVLDDLRAHVRDSLNPSQSLQARDGYVRMLQSFQEYLWEAYDWPHLKIRRRMPLQAGQRYYDLPDDVLVDRILNVQFRYQDDWFPLEYGIDQAKDFRWKDSDLGERDWPIRKWAFYEGDQIEIWPVPSIDVSSGSLEGYVEFESIRELRPFVDDSDRCDIDANLLVKHAAGEILAQRGAADAPLKQNSAAKLLREMKRQKSPRKTFQMFGIGKPDMRGVDYDDVMPRVHYRKGP